MEPWSKEEEAAAELAWRQQQVEQKDRSNQRNSLIGFIVGFGLLVFGIIAAGTSHGMNGDPRPGLGLFVAALGVLLLALSIYFRGKRY